MLPVAKCWRGWLVAGGGRPGCVPGVAGTMGKGRVGHLRNRPLSRWVHQPHLDANMHEARCFVLEL